ncbi:MAG TPA: hypothetical protein DDW65_09895 [Firmicutes bacterium]|jgi:hypothetical protein|nr:hypothetical protein [Bacillota bacterium]
MKRLLIAFLACGLLLGLPLSSFAAVHPLNSEFVNWSTTQELLTIMFRPENDQWFDCSKPQPSLNIEAVHFPKSKSAFGFPESQYLALNFSVNDQSFVSIAYTDLFKDQPMEKIEFVAGSYLFDCGLFLGLNDLHSRAGALDDVYDASPGYRFNLNDNGYIALSCDYLDSGDDSDIGGYEADGMYYLKKAKLFGEIYQSDSSDGNDYYMLGANVALSDEMTMGMKIESINNSFEDQNVYQVGFTWSKNKVIVNSKFGKCYGYDFNYFAYGVTYSFNDNWNLGATCGKIENLTKDPGYALKLSYKTGLIHFSLIWDKDYYRNISPIF